MKILIVAHYYPPHPGGLEIVVQKQAESLVKDGYVTKVFTPQNNNQKTNVKIEKGVIVCRYKSFDFFDKRFGIPFPVVGVDFIRDVIRESKEADIIHVHDVFYLTSWITYFISLIYDKPLVLTQHVAMVEHKSFIVKWLQKIIYKTIGKLIFQKSRAIIVYNHIVKTFLEKNGVDPKKIFELKNGVDLDFFKSGSVSDKNKFRKEFGLPQNKPVILFAGRLVTKKGFDKLYEARSNKYEIVFAGPGTVNPKWLKEPGVHFFGPYDYPTIKKLYLASDLFVFPAVGEIFTVVMQEAMACGLPIITTNDPGYKPYDFDKKMISLVEPKPKILKDEILKVIKNKELTEKMSLYSIELVKKWFDWKKNFSGVTNIYTNIVGYEVKNTSQKKLLVVTPYFYPKIGGVEEHTFNLYQGLVKKGYEITVVTSKDQPDVNNFETLFGMKIIRLPYQFKLSNTPINFKWIGQIKSIIKEENPTMIMTHSPVPFMPDIATFVNKKIPIILKYHSGSMKKENGIIDNLLITFYEKFILRQVIKKTDHLICTSDFVRNEFLKDFKYKSTTITPAVDIKMFFPVSIATPDVLSILFVGRIDKTSTWKGLRYLIDSFKLVHKKHPTVRLIIVGNGDGLKDHVEHVKKLNLLDFVDFLGSKKGESLAKIYQQSTLLVLPSTTESESFGMVIIEAMACKKPIIGSRVGGIPYVIDDGVDGLLVPPKNILRLSKAILTILENKKIAKKMGENGYKKVIDRYTWDKKIEETNQLILKILGK